MGTVHPAGLSAHEFEPLCRSLAEVVQSSREIENVLLGLFEQWQKALREFSSFAARSPARLSESSPPPTGSPTLIPAQESILAGQIEFYRRQSQEVAESFAQLRSLWSELLSWMKESLHGAKLAWEHSSPDASGISSWGEPFHRLQKEREALEQQCRQLEAQLAQKTQEAAHLAETLEQHKRQIARQQEQWAKHLQMVKPLIDSLFTFLTESPFSKDMDASSKDAPSDAESSQGLSSQAENIFPFVSPRTRKGATG